MFVYLSLYWKILWAKHLIERLRRDSSSQTTQKFHKHDFYNFLAISTALKLFPVLQHTMLLSGIA